LTDIIEKLFQKITPKNIILNGDILHSFSTLNYEIKQEFLRIIELLKKRSTRIYFIKGSHDTFIEKLVEPINFRSKFFIDEDILITHGNYSIDISKEINTIVIGHEHPCVEINLEKIPCFLFKHHYDRILNKFINYIILPSFNPLIEGVLINDQEFISPMLKDL
ncbi:MAG: metallophosphoesterase, partial [Candidatus Helarchaeota archaeon]